MKKKINFKIMIVLIVIIVIVGIVLGLKLYKNYTNSNAYKLKEVGYSKEQVEKLKKYSQTEIDYFINNEHFPKLFDILEEEYYISSNLSRYIDYYKKNEISPSEIISIVNVKADSDWYTNSIETDLTKDNLMLVNKYHYLKDYHPEDIVNIKNWYSYAGNSIKQEVNQKYIEMWNAAKEDGITLIVNSSYRTNEYQTGLYENRKEQQGQANADKYAARPGHSEHESGLALDIFSPGYGTANFETSDAYTWLINNSYKYGFILRYPKDKEHLTGYGYESWHYRYVGVEVAEDIHQKGLTFDEYYAYYIEKK